MRRANRFTIALACAGLLIAGCGDDGDAASITGTAAPTTAGGGSTSTSTTTPNAGATLTVVSSSLGEILADGSGRTLYVFSEDGPNTSNCTATCLTTWPRYAPPEVEGSPAVDPTSVDSFSVDGVEQATIDEQPLYYYADDTNAGDVNGHGVGGNWFAVRPDGTPVS